MRQITFVNDRTTTIRQPVRTVGLVGASRQVTITDVCRTITVSRSPRVMSLQRIERTVSPVRPVRTVTVIQGLQGRRGPAGAAYVHTQSTPSLSWVVYHQLGVRPVITIVIDDEAQEGRVSYPNLDSALIEFNTAVSGSATCVG